MAKNIIISILVVSNLVFLMFALFQKREAERMARVAYENQTVASKNRVVAETIKVRASQAAEEAEHALMIARQTEDSLRIELAKFQR
jgi:hypothetical protein